MAFEWARVGAKVTCVDAGARRYWVEGEQPSHGAIYTISRMFVDAKGDLALEFIELKKAPKAKILLGRDAGYGAWRFRPVISQADDMEMFRTLLNPTPLERLDRLAEKLDWEYETERRG